MLVDAAFAPDARLMALACATASARSIGLGCTTLCAAHAVAMASLKLTRQSDDTHMSDTLANAVAGVPVACNWRGSNATRAHIHRGDRDRMTE